MPGTRPPTAVEQYIQQLGAVDGKTSTGVFSLDRERAREMLRRFQLPTPHHFVLPLVRALVRRGATAIAATVDAAGVCVTASGAIFDQEDLSGLYDAAFARSETPELVARRQLALALGAAQSLDLRWLVLQSGSGDTAAELRYRPGEPERLDATPPPRDGTSLRLRYALKAEVVRMSATTALPEAALLAERCRFAGVPVTVDGLLVSRGSALPEAAGTASLDLDDGARAVVGLRPGERAEAVAHLVMDGVRVASHAIRGPRGLEAVVDASDLQTDLSQVEVVRDARYDRRLVALVEHPDLRLLERTLALRAVASPPLDAVEPELLALRAGLGDPGAAGRAPARTLPRLLAEAPLFRVADSPITAPARLCAIAGAAGAGDPLAVGEQGTVLTGEGVRWAPLPSPTRGALAAVWAADRYRAFAVGERGTILHLDHGVATRHATPTHCRLTAVWGSSPADVWAAEWDGPLLHFDGHAWTHADAPTTCYGEALWGARAGEALLVGDHGAILQQEGWRWRPVPSGTRARLRAIWGQRDGPVLIAGDGGTLLRRDATGGFEPLPTGTSASLRALWGASPREVWIAGEGGTLLRFDGERCHPAGRRWGFDFRGLWGASADLVWAVGGPETRLVHWNGLVWSGSHLTLADLLARLEVQDAIDFVARPLRPAPDGLILLHRRLCLQPDPEALAVLRRVLGGRLRDVTDELDPA